VLFIEKRVEVLTPGLITCERDDKNWLKHSFAFKNGDSVKLDYKDVELGNYEPKERKY
jgi:hypothetical protein